MQRARTVLLLASCAAFAGLFAVFFWLCDDAYISLRTVDNWVAGRGLRWNAFERVQSFTHPLWLLLLAGDGEIVVGCANRGLFRLRVS